MNVLIPKAVTAAMFAPGTNIPEVDTTTTPPEEAWAGPTAYSAGARVTRAGWWWAAVKAVPANSPAPDAAGGGEFWEKDETSPTNRNAPFDEYLSTKARRLGEVVLQLDVGFCTGMAAEALEGDLLEFTATAAGANLIPPMSVPLWQQAFGLWEYLFGELQRATRFRVDGIPVHPAARYTLKVKRNTPTVEAAVGYMSVGQWSAYNAPKKDKGGTEFGAEATPKSFSFQQDRPDGTYVRRAGRKATNITGTCVIAATDGPRAKTMLDRVLDIPVAVSISDLPSWSYLNTVGFLTGTVRAAGPKEAVIVFSIKGNV